MEIHILRLSQQQKINGLADSPVIGWFTRQLDSMCGEEGLEAEISDCCPRATRTLALGNLDPASGFGVGESMDGAASHIPPDS